jgi:penicillin amidase
MQNMVVADTAGRIGLISPGRVPVRKPENDLHGLAPAPGWDEKYDWAGWVPVDETPRETDPARGWLATANQRITPPGYPYFFTSEWGLPYRQQRIEQVLGSRPKHSLEDLAALQADELSLAVPALLPWLQKARSVHPLAPAAQAQLAGFDGRMAADRAAPLIFWAWQRQLARALFADDVSEALWEKSLSGRNFQEALERVLRADDAAWCDHRGTPLAETCAEQTGLALTRALEELQQRFGADVGKWRWGDAHQARGEHRPFSRVPVLVRLFELRTPVGGDTHTVNVSRVNLRPDKLTGDLFHSDHGPSLRALYDLADPAHSRVMTSTGQSGNPFSAHFRSFVQPWAAVKYRPLWPEPGAPSRVLVVQPAQSTP